MKRRLVYLDRDKQTGDVIEVLFNGDEKYERVPYWETTPRQSRELATRVGQFFNALRDGRARDELKGLGKQYGVLDIRVACEHAWKQPGLGAMETVAEVRRYLEERYDENGT